MSHDPKQALQDARRKLEIAGSPSPMIDASALIHAVQGDAKPWDPLTDAQMADLNRFVARRARREPISHIIGKRAFWMHDFIVTSAVLDPRPETETLVSCATDAPVKTVLDLGTGSGCILLSILYELPEAHGTGVDLSAEALDVARRNAGVVGVEDRVTWQVSDWFEAIDGTFDLIVSNPPYISKAEMAALAPELSFEPRMALTDEADGLSAYRILTEQAPRYLSPGGRLMVEIGLTQGPAVSDLFHAAGFESVSVHTDLDGRDRVVSGVFSPQTDAN